MSTSAFLRSVPEGVVIAILVQPKASRSEVSGPFEDRLKIRIAAPPVDGEANEELMRFLKKKLKGVASDLSLVRGHTSRKKDVLAEGADLKRVREALLGSERD